MATRGQGGGAIAGDGRGRLTRHLQGAFLEACPAGWACRIEAPLVAPPAAARLGFEPRADVLLTHDDDARHIAPGRKALLASTAMFMRAVGLPAFQVDLLPDLDGHRIMALNAAPPEELAAAPIDVVAWARRRVRFLAWDPASGLFAPSKFCAFVPAGMPERTPGQARVVREPPGGMTATLYFSLGEQDPRFDGHVARRHLERRLRYRAAPLSGAEGPLSAAWRLWRDRCPLTLADDAVALVPPLEIRELLAA